jgi:hypothetical protein
VLFYVACLGKMIIFSIESGQHVSFSHLILSVVIVARVAEELGLGLAR